MARLLIARGTPPVKSWIACLTAVVDDLRIATGLLELKVDVTHRLVFGQRPDVKANGHAIQKIRMLRAAECGAQ